MTEKDRPTGGFEILGSTSRLAAALKNASVLARFGRLEPRRGTLYSVPHESPVYRLRCYDVKNSRKACVPIILVPPLMMSADVFDVSKKISAVDYLNEQGFSVWLVDFGEPADQEGGLHRDMSDHVVAVNDAIDFVYAQQRKPVHLAGYCQGGIFCYLAVAYRKSKNVGSIVSFAAPVNLYKNFLPGVSDELTLKVLETIGEAVPTSILPSSIPGWASKNLFRMLAPVKQLQSWLSLLKMLDDKDAILKGEDQRSFMSDGFVAWPGPAMLEFMRQMLMGNRMVSGGCVIEGRTVSLTDITCPMLAVIGGNDSIARPRSVRGIVEAAPNSERYQLYLPQAGHLGVLVGGSAMKNTWSTVNHWLSWRDGNADKPERISLLDEVGSEDNASASEEGNLATALTKTMFGMSKSLLGTAGDLLGSTKTSLQTMSDNFSSQLSHLTRLQKLDSDSKVGFALSLEEQARKSPDDTYFLYAERAHTYANSNQRVDNIVRGLISIGVRRGDHVGVLMHARPSALATNLAVNRLGAVAVQLRDRSQLATELKLAEVQYLIADPENAQAGVTTFNGQTYILGGFGRSRRELPESVIDMEKIDPSRVALPDWYQPSPGKADEVAFISFSRLGSETHCDKITHRQWALYSLGTASATRMVKGDTVYCWTPLYDPTGMLIAVSASLVAGARICLARQFDTNTFWHEVRSYGANIVFYSGGMLRELVDAPKHKLERGNSIRLFAGTGMPEALSQRVAERFGDASIMEIYLSTRHHAYLANLKNNKSGAVFQQLPGSNDIALVHWDYHTNLPFYDTAGYLCPTPVGAVGMLLVKADNGISYRDNTYISDVFEKGDGWQISGDLFLLDNDGDYHFVDRASNLILTKDDAIPTPPIETAISTIDGISVATAYGVTIEGCDFQVPVASVVLKDKFKLVALDLTTALTEQLDNKSLPLVVIVANSLPMTPSYQVQKQILADTGIPQGGLKRGQAFWFNNKSAKYESLTQASLSRLIRDLIGLAATESATARAATKGSALEKKRVPKKTKARKKKVHTKTAKKRDLSPNIVKKETELNGGMSASDMTDGASSLIETTGQDAHLH
ncbi:MAG: AMP-binding protein [Porticoccaceae bacterium]|nr:AMP-binding protein [Porticoccaceae bacterium]